MMIRREEVRVALTIAGTDPCGGAGINTDLQVFRDFGFHGAAAITAVVWQNTCGVRGYRELEPSELQGQLEAVGEDLAIDAVKIGMVPTGDLMVVVSRFLETLDPEVPVVLDPVMASGSGERTLMAPTGLQSLERLGFRVDLITPNSEEAAMMLGRRARGMGPAELAEGLLDRGWQRVLVKGGHVRRNPQAPVVDWYGDGEGVVELSGVKALDYNVRGTGCQLSSAIAVARARGKSWREAVDEARRYLQRVMSERAAAIGKGHAVVVRIDDAEES